MLCLTKRTGTRCLRRERRHTRAVPPVLRDELRWKPVTCGPRADRGPDGFAPPQGRSGPAVASRHPAAQSRASPARAAGARSIRLPFFHWVSKGVSQSVKPCTQDRQLFEGRFLQGGYPCVELCGASAASHAPFPTTSRCTIEIPISKAPQIEARQVLAPIDRFRLMLSHPRHQRRPLAAPWPP